MMNIPVPSISHTYDADCGHSVTLSWRGKDGGVAVIIACPQTEEPDPNETDACWAFGDKENSYGTSGANFWLRDGIPAECIAKIHELTS